MANEEEIRAALGKIVDLLTGGQETAARARFNQSYEEWHKVLLQMPEARPLQILLFDLDLYLNNQHAREAGAASLEKVLDSYKFSGE